MENAFGVANAAWQGRSLARACTDQSPGSDHMSHSPMSTRYEYDVFISYRRSHLWQNWVKDKCDLVYQHVYESYFGGGQSVYETAA